MIVAAVGSFLPRYLFTIKPEPYFKKHGKRPDIDALIDGATTATVGAIIVALTVVENPLMLPQIERCLTRLESSAAVSVLVL